MNRRDTVFALLMLGAAPLAAEAQNSRLYRVGVVFQGGLYSATIDGLRAGLKELGLSEEKQFLLRVRDAKGDLKSVEAAAIGLEVEKVDLIYSIATSVTLAVKRATKTVPIVFYAGTDPVSVGLVDSYRKPGGRLTGIHSRFTDLTAKRLELLKTLVPTIRRVVTFYNPSNPAAQQSVKIARKAATQLTVELIERPVSSVEDLRTGLHALRPMDADALLYVSDAMVTSQAQLVIDVAQEKRLPAMFQEQGSVAKGALASYGASFYEIGRLSAKYVQDVLLGANPGNLPIEQIDTLRFAINLKTAKALGLTIPESVLARADEIIR